MLAKSFEFFLKSTTTSNISPFKTLKNLPWENFVCKCIPLRTFFFEEETQVNTNFCFLKSLFKYLFKMPSAIFVNRRFYNIETFEVCFKYFHNSFIFCNKN